MSTFRHKRSRPPIPAARRAQMIARIRAIDFAPAVQPADLPANDPQDQPRKQAPLRVNWLALAELN